MVSRGPLRDVNQGRKITKKLSKKSCQSASTVNQHGNIRMYNQTLSLLQSQSRGITVSTLNLRDRGTRARSPGGVRRGGASRPGGRGVGGPRRRCWSAGGRCDMVASLPVGGMRGREGGARMEGGGGGLLLGMSHDVTTMTPQRLTCSRQSSDDKDDDNVSEWIAWSHDLTLTRHSSHTHSCSGKHTCRHSLDGSHDFPHTHTQVIRR